ncbi:MAG: DUF87 domain-containing protein [Lachnospiraceae bacterium]
MKYIVNAVTELIVNNAPSIDGEMMIRVDGFEDIKIYENLSRKVAEKLSQIGLTVDIKLAKNKWNYFVKKSGDSTTLQSMEQHNWVAQEESITHYRNLHQSNVLVLLGTEDEEDKGGLLNCYTITPDSLVFMISGNYHEIFADLDNCFSDTELGYVDKLYKDLFEFIAVDICKLSSLVDKWNNHISNINDFIEKFYESLPEWGLPFKKLELPTAKELESKKNILRIEYNFISRQMFKKLTITQYKKYKKQVNLYDAEKENYSSEWDGWNGQSIKSYNEFEKIVMGYIRGENVSLFKEKLLGTDFSIIEAVLDMKVPVNKVERKTIPTVTGEPLEAFTNALLYTLCGIKEDELQVEKIIFDIKQAEVVCMYSDTEDDEEKQQLKDTWDTICRHTNGVVEYLNQKMWSVNNTEIELECAPVNIFSPQSSIQFIDDGIVKAANSNKSISKINFVASCISADGNVIKKVTQEFQWKFENTCAWLHNFSDLCLLDVCNNDDGNYIPVASIKKLNSLLFAKSEEEFFDLYDESDIKYDFNLAEYIDNNIPDEEMLISAKFDKLGEKFVKFAYSVANEGFYVCLLKQPSELQELVQEYVDLGNYLTQHTFPENLKWIMDAFIHAFNIEKNEKVIADDSKSESCIVPAWHPATLEKLNDQKIFFLDGCEEWWKEQEYEQKVSRKEIDDTIENLLQMSMMQSSLDIFPSYGQQYFGAINSFGAFSVYGRSDIENNSRLKDMIHKDAIFDDDFDNKENTKMNDNAKMIYGVISDYTKAFPNAFRNLSIVFVDPSELQPIIAAVYKYIEIKRKKYPDEIINITIKILVKPENKGGRNYLSYWMDECFSQDANVNIRTYLNEWRNKSDLDKLLNGNNDIVYVMDLLKLNNLQFVKESGSVKLDLSQCRFPIVFKPSPVSDTSSKIKRRIELSQPQFRTSYAHTQIVRYRNNFETLPDGKFIAVREVCIDSEAQNIVYSLHEKAYWVVCVDSGMDGALLRNDDEHKGEYSIIGFSTGKGAYGQYNLTITTRKTILETIQHKLESRLYQLFHWEKNNIDKAAQLCLCEASGLDGISLLSAINQKDHNINEFMAYVLTSLREKEADTKTALKIVVHLDSYKHWFSGEIEKDDTESQSRPDFLVLEANLTDGDKLSLNATVVECKIASEENASAHKEKAIGQVKHGINRLSTIFDPTSKSIKRRYWYAQLYRALAFAQVTFSDNTSEFAELASKLRSVLDGNFEINWNGKILGFWLDMDGNTEIENDTDSSNIKLFNIPQKRIQQLLLQESVSDVDYVSINAGLLLDEENEESQIAEREREINDEIKEIQKNKRKSVEPSTSTIQKDIELKEEQKPEEPISEETVKDLKAEEKDIETEKNDSGNKVEVEENVDDVQLSDGNTDDTSAVDTNEAENTTPSDLKVEDARVLIGTDKTSEKVFWEFGHKQLANRHLLITGTSGQGKTYSIQTMLYELSKSNVSSVIFDYTEGFRLDQLEKEFVKKMGDHINQRVVKFENVPINPFKRQFLEFAGDKFPEKDSDIAARFSNIMTHVYSFGDQQSAAIFDAVRIGLSKYKDGMNMKHFQEELENEKQSNRSAQTVISKMQPFFYSIEFEQDSDFDWENVLYPTESTATIFQLTAIDRDMQVIITELMLWDLWYYTMKNGSKDKPFVVVLDEAQNLSHKDKSPSAKILTEGRKFGWSAWYATQSLKVLDDEEVTRLMQSAFKIYFKPTDDEIIKMAKQLDPTDGNIWLTAIKNLKKGQCIATGERVKPDGKFGIVKPTITSVTSFDERS